MNADCEVVLRQFPHTQNVTRFESLGSAGGFSGAALYRVSAGDRRYCLRRWPPSHPNATQLQWIHDVLNTASEQGCDFVPAPLPTAAAATFLKHAGHLWELTPWMPGEANYDREPNREKLCAAMTALATFHRATGQTATQSRRPAVPPGITDRLCKLEQWAGDGLDELTAAIDDSLWPAFAQRSRQLLGLFPLAVDQVRRCLTNASRLEVILQPCIRDVWHDHLLFTNNVVTGLVDFGAMRADNVATDIARLVGSLVGDDAAQWRIALDAYDRIGPLSDDERSLVVAYDQSGVLMSGLSWVDWIFRQRLRFDHTDAILRRVDANIGRLEHLAGR